jgi:hypothetical protein
MNNLAGREMETLQEIADGLTEEHRQMIGHCFKNKLSVAMLSLSYYQGERGMHGKAAETVRGACNEMLDFVKILCGDSRVGRGDRPTIECIALVAPAPELEEVDIDLSDF